MEKNGTFASPATAFARSVLPVPGGPTRSAPFGILPPRAVYFFGFLRKSTISITSSFAPYRPATSLKVTLTSSLSASLPVALPTLKGLPMPPPAPPAPRFMPRNIHTQKRMRSSVGKIHWASSAQVWSAFWMTTLNCSPTGRFSFSFSKFSSGSNRAETRK